jgi:RNA polymerase sigma factor (sigma-70 family)
MSVAEDRELILATRQGDYRAFEILVQRHQASIFNVAYRMFGNRRDAEDAAQDAFFRAFRALDKFDENRPLAPWLKRIAANVCLNKLEKDRIRPAVTATDVNRPGQETASMDDWHHARPSPEQEAVANESAAQVRAMILRLPPQFRVAIELRHFQGLSYIEMAESLDRSVGNVKSDLFRARKMLAQMLGEEELREFSL